MSTVRKIAKNTLVLLISQIIVYGLSFIYNIYIARYLGVEGFGVLSFAIAFTGIFSIIADLGLSSLATREVSRDNSLANTYLVNLSVIKIILIFIAFLLIFLFVNLLDYPQETVFVVYIISMSTFIGSFSSLFYSIFQAYEKMEYQSLSQIFLSILMLSGAIYAINQQYGILEFAFIYLISNVIVFSYIFMTYILKFKIIEFKISLNFWKKALKNAIPLSLALLFSSVAFKIDTVMLSILVNNVAVGWYTAAYKLMEALIFIPTVFSIVIFPVFSSYFISSKDSLKLSYEKSFKYLSILGFPIAMGTMLLANEIIILVYNSEFIQSQIALKILIWAIPFIFISYILKILLISIDKQNIFLKISLISMFLNITLNLIIIPYYSYIGASVVTVITEFTTFIICLYYSSILVSKISFQKYIFKPMIASIIMGLFILTVKINLISVILISVIIYIIALLLLKTFSKEDIYLLKQIIDIKIIR